MVRRQKPRCLRTATILTGLLDRANQRSTSHHRCREIVTRPPSGPTDQCLCVLVSGPHLSPLTSQHRSMRMDISRQTSFIAEKPQQCGTCSAPSGSLKVFSAPHASVTGCASWRATYPQHGHSHKITTACR